MTSPNIMRGYSILYFAPNNQRSVPITTDSYHVKEIHHFPNPYSEKRNKRHRVKAKANPICDKP